MHKGDFLKCAPDISELPQNNPENILTQQPTKMCSRERKKKIIIRIKFLALQINIHFQVHISLIFLLFFFNPLNHSNWKNFFFFINLWSGKRQVRSGMIQTTIQDQDYNYILISINSRLLYEPNNHKLNQSNISERHTTDRSSRTILNKYS